MLPVVTNALKKRLRWGRGVLGGGPRPGLARVARVLEPGINVVRAGGRVGQLRQGWGGLVGETKGERGLKE